MPSRKKKKGKAKKSKSLQQQDQGKGRLQQFDREIAAAFNEGQNDNINDELGGKDIADIFSKMEMMRGQIISSLGDGFDAESLIKLDKKLCDYFLTEDSIYYDDGRNNAKSANPVKPTDGEVDMCKRSDIIRKAVLRKASGIDAMRNFMGGQGYKNLQVYQDFYGDLMTYHYAWFEIIFKNDGSELFSACMTIAKFASVRLEQVGKGMDEVENIVELLREMKELFQSTVKEHDAEACDDAGMLEYDFYELCYKLSVEMTKANKKGEADQYFDEAFMLENTWGYHEDRHCAKVLEFATGRKFSDEELFMEVDEYALTNEGFYHKCLQAYVRRRKGSVSWEPSLDYFSEDSEEDGKNSPLHEKEKQKWRKILNDPNSTKPMRDLAQSQLNDAIGRGKIFTGTPEFKSCQEEDLHKLVAGWAIVEDFEEGKWGEYNGNAVVNAAADEILNKEGDDRKDEIYLSARGMQADGSYDFLVAYPKLQAACNRIISDINSDSEMKSNAYATLSFLRGQSSLEGIRGKAMDDIKKAVKLNPEDWRLHAMLATRNMAIYNTALALESICRAQDLTTDQFAMLSLGIRRGKILFNLSRPDETITVFEKVISLYENGLKDHPQINDRLIGRLAVAEYMLVITYGMQGQHKKASRHYIDAEEKRNSLEEEMAKKIDWTSRMTAEVMITNTSPGIVPHGECHHCGKVTDKPLRCAACKAVFYCSKECQKKDWKNGHKKQCKKLKSEQKDKKAADIENSKIRRSRSNLPPLDVNLDPKSLWKEGVQLSKSGFYEDSAWKFLIALFMDASLDANDMKPVKVAVEGCAKTNPVAMALSPLLCPSNNLIWQRAAEVYEQAANMPTITNIETGATVDDVDHDVFGLGMCHIMYARVLGRVFACKSAADARSTKTKDAFDEVARLVRSSDSYIDSQRWLTLQFELGYSSMDVGAINEAEKWLNQFTTTIANTKSLRSKEGAVQHWSKMNSSAKSRLSQLPLMKSISLNNPGMLQECETGGEECQVM